MGLSMRTERATLDEVKERLAQGKKRDITNVTTEDLEERVIISRERDDQDKQEKKEKKKEYKRLKKEEEERQKQLAAADEDDVFAMMGLPSGFGGSKK
jgi:U4/U6.U5 tri-snRNP component SNU23